MACFDAAVFDLDGVVTITASVHSAAWKELFDGFLRAREQRTGEPFQPFTEADYRTYVDGRPRRDGIRSFLAARGISLSEGSPTDAPGVATIAGLARRKNDLFQERLQRGGVEVDPDAIAFIRNLRAYGVRVGAASSSKNAQIVLESADISELFDTRVDGVTSEQLRLRGKPAPDLFLTCLHQLGVQDPLRALVAEDATVGVEAGRAGGFGLVLGVDRGGRASDLRAHGADWVIGSFREISFERVDGWFRQRAQQERCA